MTWWSFIKNIAVPTVMLCLLAGGIAGFIFGCALALRSGPTLQFIARMNRWVSTREALKPLEEPHQIEPAPESPYRRLLGVLFIVGGTLTIYFLLTRLHVGRLVDAKRQLGLAIVLDATKTVFLAGRAFALVIGYLVLHQVPDAVAVLGVLLVVGAGVGIGVLYLARKDYLRGLHIGLGAKKSLIVSELSYEPTDTSYASQIARQKADFGAQRADFKKSAPVAALLPIQDTDPERFFLQIVESL